MKKRSGIIYLDNNATTPVAREVARVMTESLRTNFGNPSSSHYYGKRAKAAVERGRKQVANLINAKPEEIFFMSGGTEANNLAIIGTARRFKSGHIISSCIEHPSVTNPLKHLEGRGFSVTWLPVDKYGIVNAEDVEKSIRKNTILITIMHANNETGAIQPITKTGSIARRKGIAFHCDAAQSVGKIPVNVQRMKVDFLTLVSHKFYGPKGAGALYVKGNSGLNPILYGAAHEKGLRPGTENVAAIAGIGSACKLAGKEMNTRTGRLKLLADMLFRELRREIPGIKLNGHPARRLPNTINVSFPDISGSLLLERLRHDIAASTGSACHEGRHLPSPVLKAMGLSDAEALSALRLSLGRDNNERQIMKAAKAITAAYRAL